MFNQRLTDKLPHPRDASEWEPRESRFSRLSSRGGSPPDCSIASRISGVMFIRPLGVWMETTGTVARLHVPVGLDSVLAVGAVDARLEPLGIQQLGRPLRKSGDFGACG